MKVANATAVVALSIQRIMRVGSAADWHSITGGTYLRWLDQNRCLSEDYEQNCESEEVWIYIAMTCLIAKRIAAA